MNKSEFKISGGGACWYVFTVSGGYTYLDRTDGTLKQSIRAPLANFYFGSRELAEEALDQYLKTSHEESQMRSVKFIHVATPEISAATQKILFANGYKWVDGTSEVFISSALRCPYIYIHEQDKNFSHSEREPQPQEYSVITKVTIEQLFSPTLQKESDMSANRYVDCINEKVAAVMVELAKEKGYEFTGESFSERAPLLFMFEDMECGFFEPSQVEPDEIKLTIDEFISFVPEAPKNRFTVGDSTYIFDEDDNTVEFDGSTLECDDIDFLLNIYENQPRLFEMIEWADEVQRLADISNSYHTLSYDASNGELSVGCRKFTKKQVAEFKTKLQEAQN